MDCANSECRLQQVVKLRGKDVGHTPAHSFRQVYWCSMLGLCLLLIIRYGLRRQRNPLTGPKA